MGLVAEQSIAGAAVEVAERTTASAVVEVVAVVAADRCYMNADAATVAKAENDLGDGFLESFGEKHVVPIEIFALASQKPAHWRRFGFDETAEGIEVRIWKDQQPSFPEVQQLPSLGICQDGQVAGLA